MEKRELLSRLDHTLLKQTATWEEIRRICEEGMKYQTASVCIPPCYVKRAKEYVQDKVNICTVIGFPNGNTTTAVKVLETRDAVENGADEIDMVINLGMVKERDYDRVLEEIQAVKQACGGKVLKVIIETCLLTEDEKLEMCRVVTRSGAEYIKTSTGFSTGGATFADVELMRRAGEGESSRRNFFCGRCGEISGFGCRPSGYQQTDNLVGNIKFVFLKKLLDLE